MPTIHQIDPHDEQALREWYCVAREGAVAGREHPLVFGFEELASSLRTESPTTKRTAFAAYEDGTVVGALKLDYSLKENLDSVDWTLNVAPRHRGRGYGTALFEHGVAEAAAHGRHKHITEIDVPLSAQPTQHPGARFALEHGFQSLHTEHRMVLELPVAARLLTDLRDDAAAHHGDYTFVSWVDSCPADYLHAYVDMYNTMERDVPTGELDLEPKVWDAERVRESERRLADQGFTSLVTAARHSSGEFAGYSLMFVPANTPDEVYQDDTLVVSHHRGHRLGTALKARNLVTLQDKHPDRLRVHTWTDPDNGPMQRINRDFGFRIVEVMHEFERVDAEKTSPDVIET